MSIIRKLVKRLLLPSQAGVTSTPFGLAGGNRLWIDPNHSLRVWLGIYERELIRHFRSLATPGRRCFDVGGDKGYYAVALASLCSGPVITFEPDKDNAAIIGQVAKANPKLDITLEESYVGRDGPGHISLDTAAAKYFHPDFVKMDIEGAELEALETAPALLAARRTSFIIETHGQSVEDRCVAILEAAGYGVERIGLSRWSGESSTRDPHHDHNGWIVAVPK